MKTLVLIFQLACLVFLSAIAPAAHAQSAPPVEQQAALSEEETS